MDKTNKLDLQPRICESCGIEFGCGAKLDGCWCSEITLDPSQAGNIKAKFNDCLCPKCLENVASYLPAQNLDQGAP